MVQKGQPGRAVWLGIWSSFPRRIARRRIPDRRDRPACRDRARIRTVGILRAVRIRAVDGRRTHRGVAGQGIPLRRNRPRHHHRRFRSDHERAALHPGHGVPAQRLSFPAGADRHFRVCATDDRHRKNERGRPDQRANQGAAAHRVAPQGAMGNPVPAVPARMVDAGRHPDRRAAGHRRQRGDRHGLRPGEKVLEASGAIRQRQSRGHHCVGGLLQRQRWRLARYHHGVRHPRRRGDCGDARAR